MSTAHRDPGRPLPRVGCDVRRALRRRRHVWRSRHHIRVALERGASSTSRLALPATRRGSALRASELHARSRRGPRRSATAGRTGERIRRGSFQSCRRTGPSSTFACGAAGAPDSSGHGRGLTRPCPYTRGDGALADGRRRPQTRGAERRALMDGGSGHRRPRRRRAARDVHRRRARRFAFRPETGRPRADCTRGPARTSWHGHGVLMLQRPDEAHAIWLFWRGARRASSAAGTSTCSDRSGRTAHGYDTQDLELDIWIPVAGSWRWKDEELLDVRVREGRFTGEQAESIRESGAGSPPSSTPGGRWWDAGLGRLDARSRLADACVRSRLGVISIADMAGVRPRPCPEQTRDGARPRSNAGSSSSASCRRAPRSGSGTRRRRRRRRRPRRSTPPATIPSTNDCAARVAAVVRPAPRRAPRRRTRRRARGSSSGTRGLALLDRRTRR